AKPVAASTAEALVAPGRPLLEAALDLLSGEELERAEESAVYAANAALVANRVHLDDAEEVSEQLRDARATLSLGLELISSGDPQRAARALAEEPIREIFQTAMGEAYRLQTRGRLPQAQSATVLDEPLESVLQALLRQRPLFHEPGQRRPRAFASRAEVARAESLLEEGEATVSLLSRLGLSPAELGPKADEAGLGPAVVKASLAVRALANSALRGEPFSLRGAADEFRADAEGFDAKLSELLRGAAEGDAGLRAAERIRTALQPPAAARRTNK